MMMKIAKFAAAAVAVATLAGCPGGAIPGMTGTGTTGTTGTTVRGADAALAGMCSATAPAAATTVGTAKHGRYSNQTLPNAWDNLADESKVSESIAKFETEGGNTWNCFNKFYPGALTVYYGIKAAK